MDKQQDSYLLKRISELEKSLESLEERSGLLDEEIKNVKGAISSLKADAGIGSVSAAALDAAADTSAKADELADKMEPEIIEMAAVIESYSANSQSAQKKQIQKSFDIKTAAARRRVSSEKQRSVSLEQFIGKNAMGIGASVLVFIAMIMFATLLMPYIGRELKCAAMYIFSFILIGLGEWIYRKQKNGYTILSACGAGVLYISIVATHIYFRFIDMIPLYILLLLWMAFVSYLGRKRSFIFVIVGQIGIVMAIVMSSYGIDTSLYLYLRFAFLLISEALYFILFFRSEYKYKLVNTIGLICAMTVFDAIVEAKYLNYQYSANRPGIAVVILSMLIVALAACRLISVSTNKKNMITSIAVSLGGACSVFLTCYFLRDSMHNLGYLLSIANVPITADSAWCYLPLTIYLAAVLVFAALKERKTGFKTDFAEYIVFAALMLSLLLLPSRVSPMLAAVILFVLVVYNFIWDKNNLYLVTQFAVCVGIVLTMGAESIYAPLAMLALSVAQMVYSRTQNPLREFRTYELFAYLTTIGFMFVLAPMVLDRLLIDDRFISFCVQTVLIITLQFAVKKTNWMYNNEHKLSLYYFANLFFMVITAWGISFADDIPQIIIGTVLAAALYSINLKSLIDINENFGAYIAAKYSVLVGVLLYHLNVSSQIYSIVYLIAAIICVIIGFRINNKSIRLYGLILSMLSIVKLILIDISYSNTLMRAVSFLVSGLLCFGISLVYNHIDKQQKKRRDL